MTTVSNTKEIHSINIEKVVTPRNLNDIRFSTPGYPMGKSSYKVTYMKGNQVIVKHFDSREFSRFLSTTLNAFTK
ncbi:MAG: hypothetical protein Tp139SUR343261_42 [Prokaryotic dsDNA virus sp.]|jgi:hypothetical protein|nr:MAG: hypothetical protein Tp139SUR343261_42 [Prokaryotic dsDNA virus sp.]